VQTCALPIYAELPDRARPSGRHTAIARPRSVGQFCMSTFPARQRSDGETSARAGGESRPRRGVVRREVLAGIGGPAVPHLLRLQRTDALRRARTLARGSLPPPTLRAPLFRPLGEPAEEAPKEVAPSM